MAYQKKTTTSYGGRLKNSLGGIKTGAILFAIGTVLLFANEGNFVKTRKSLKEAGAAYPVSDVSTVDPSLNGRLIHAAARADTQDILTDNLFGVSERAIALNRTVEYFQYREQSSTETKDKMGGGQETVTTYTYQQTWSPSPINSNAFEDPDYKGRNFVLTQVESGTERASDVSFGAYKLPPFIVSSITGSSPASVNLTEDELKNFEDQLSVKQDGQMVHVQGNTVYFGKSPSSPSIGDVRVTLTKTMPADISIIAKVVNNSFDRFIASNGREVSMVSMGIVSADNMIASAQSANKASTWFLRFLGIMAVVFGLKSLFGILPALLKVLPFLGKIAGAGIGIICAVGGAAWSLTIIAIAWLFYRPLIALPMLAVAVGGILFLRSRSKANPAEATPAEAAPAEPAPASAQGGNV